MFSVFLFAQNLLRFCFERHRANVVRKKRAHSLIQLTLFAFNHQFYN